MINMKKKLIFSFSVFENCLDNRAIKIHLNCLRYYANIFDEATFILNNGELDNNPNFLEVKQQLIKLPFKNITIKEKRGSYLYESQVFYDEIITKLKSFNNTLVFFGHTKGCTNYGGRFKQDDIDTWITGLYYLSLSDLIDVEQALIKEFEPRFYGSFLSETKDDKTLPNGFALYQGSFFWLNPGRIYHDIITNTINIPQLYDRWFAEYLPGKMYEKGIHKNILLSKYNRYTFFNNDNNAYFTIDTIVDFILQEGDDKIHFNNFKNEMIHVFIDKNI